MRMIAPVLIGLIGAAILLGLGVWQVQRLAWKEAMLARINAEISGPPVSLPADPEVASSAAWQFVPVRLSGRFTGEELHVLASTRDRGAVFRVIAAFETTDGRRVLVDRGIVGIEQKDAPRPASAATIIGNIRTPEEIDSFTPAPDLASNTWFARDVPAMAAALDSEPLLLILRETSEVTPPVTPFPLDSAGIPNNHLNYAITWFLFAAVWLGMTGLWLWRIRRRLD